MYLDSEKLFSSYSIVFANNIVKYATFRHNFDSHNFTRYVRTLREVDKALMANAMCQILWKFVNNF